MTRRFRLAASVCVLIVFFVLVPVWLWGSGRLDSRPGRHAFECGRRPYLKWKHGYYRIQKGMTLAEVEAFLGPGEKEHPWAGADGWHTWDRDEIEIQVLFEGGRVSKKDVYDPGL